MIFALGIPFDVFGAGWMHCIRDNDILLYTLLGLVVGHAVHHKDLL